MLGAPTGTYFAKVNGVSQDDVDLMLGSEFGMAMGPEEDTDTPDSPSVVDEAVKVADKQRSEKGEAPTMNSQQREDKSSELSNKNIDSLFN